MRFEVMVLAAGGGACAAVDLASGGLMRATYPAPSPPLAPLDLAEAEADASADRALPDHTQPDAIALAAPPVRIGRASRRQADRYLRALHHPPNQDLLGFVGPAVPYWTLKGDRPSLAVVALGASPVIERVPGPAPREQRPLRCRFTWRGRHESLPLNDARVWTAMAAYAHDRLSGPTLARIVGGAPRRLLVALSSPHDGHCYKVVAALLPG